MFAAGLSFAASSPQNESSLSRFADLVTARAIQFTPNIGQADQTVHFISVGDKFILNLADDEIALDLRDPEYRYRNIQPAVSSDALRIRLLNAREGVRVTGAAELPVKKHCLIKSGTSVKPAMVSTFGEVVYNGVYPGIDLVYHGNDGILEYDFRVAPGADPSIIHMQFGGMGAVGLNDQGDLTINIPNGDIIQHKPVVFQVLDGKKVLVDGSFVIRDNNKVAFAVSAYDTSQPLVIDPAFSFKPKRSKSK